MEKDMSRTTINKVNSRICLMGFEIVKGREYYYFSTITNDAPIISMDGLYGSPFLGAWSVDEIENELKNRIAKG
jgi:hypothetical protein